MYVYMYMRMLCNQAGMFNYHLSLRQGPTCATA